MQEQKEHPRATSHYKFKELRIYNSTEFLWDNLKKYRQVFEREETAYVYAELSLYNKQFDLADWQLHVELKCFRLKDTKKKEICILKLDKTVSKYDPIVYIREGWGNQRSASFWEKGSYAWEAYIDGKLVSTKLFYLLESVEAQEEYNASKPSEAALSRYVKLQHLGLYEGPQEDVLPDDRVYLTAFSAQDSRFVFLDLLFKNQQWPRKWQFELLVRYYNQARELKGQLVKVVEVGAHQEIIPLSLGWGGSTPNVWHLGNYSIDLVVMDQVIATVPLRMEEHIEIGDAPVLLPWNPWPLALTPEQAEDDESFDTILKQLEELIGLQEVKKQIKQHAIYLKYLKLRRERGLLEEENINVHAVFIGNPGTGKTTVATMMGKLYKRMGLLTKGHVVVADRVDLVGEYIGQTAPKTREMIEKARGGVLFIDEAYSLARSNDDGKDFGREVIEILVKELSNGSGDIMVIAAGYPEEMERFLTINPGLQSRFKHRYEFRDFLPQELSIVADYAAKARGVTLSLGAKARLDELIIKAFRERDKTFGNARYVGDLIEKTKIQLGIRLLSSHEDRKEITDEELSIIERADVEAMLNQMQKDKPIIPVDEDLLKSALAELDQLVGMDNVKVQLRDLVSLVRFYRQMNQDVLNAFQLHTVLIGNPGTGKTTIARIIAQLYKALGILERGHLVETDRQGLVAGYVGQTAEKTDKKIKEAAGGVLFIDEAYALTQKNTSQRGDFGDEVIQTLLKRMEDQRGEFFVFVAGYPEQMDDFLKANPGLSSRFDKIIRFEDYSAAELLAIALGMFKASSRVLTPAAEKKLASYLQFIYTYRDRFFGNARTVRQLVSAIIRRNDLRRAALDIAEAKSQAKINLNDLEHLIEDPKQLVIQRKQIGF